MIIIGLTGPAGSGKDTVGDWLERDHAFTRIALADPIRVGLKAMLGLSSSDFKSPRKETPIAWLGRSPRALMQTLGTEWGRNLVTSDIWVRRASQTIAALPQPRLVVVTDIRFEDEAAWLRNIGGTLWHIRRAHVPRVRAHISEAGVALAEGDLVIENNGTLDDLHRRIDDALADRLLRA